MLITD